jgi:hypothetical protein
MREPEAAFVTQEAVGGLVDDAEPAVTVSITHLEPHEGHALAPRAGQGVPDQPVRE